jgi:hypothetical protein
MMGLRVSDLRCPFAFRGLLITRWLAFSHSIDR